MTYSQGVCSSDSECDATAGLICNPNPATVCNCPTTLSTGYCDCPNRVSGNEQYWNGAACVSAKIYNDLCSGNYMCQTLTLNLICSSGTCNCATPGIILILKFYFYLILNYI